MTCNHCKANVETNLEKLTFVAHAEVNLADKSVSVQGNNLELDKIKETINNLGYKAE